MTDYAEIIKKTEDFHEEASKLLAFVSTAAPEDLKQIPATIAGMQRRLEELRADVHAFAASTAES